MSPDIGDLLTRGRYRNLTDDELERLAYLRAGRSPVVDELAERLRGALDTTPDPAQQDLFSACPVCEALL